MKEPDLRGIGDAMPMGFLALSQQIIDRGLGGSTIDSPIAECFHIVAALRMRLHAKCRNDVGR